MTRRNTNRPVFSIALAVLTLESGAASAGVNRWTNLGPRSEATVNALATSPAAPDTVYAATAGGGVFKSEDGGETWAAINTGLDEGNVTALAVDPSSTGTLYAATGGSGVFKSTDGGATWRQSSSGMSNPSLSALVIDPAQTSKLYAVTSDARKVYRTADGAASWTSVDSVLYLATLGVDAASNLYYASSCNALYRSTDGGDHWSLLTPGRCGQFRMQLAFDPSDAKILYASFDGSLEKSTDGGATWTLSNTGIAESVTTIAISATDPKILVVGTINGKSYTSSDAAVSWRRLGGLAASSNPVRALLIGPAPASAVLAARGGTVLRGSTDVNLPWINTGVGLDAASLGSIAVHPTDTSTILAAGSFDIFRSGDGGATWSGSLPDTSFFLPRQSFGLVFSPAHPALALAGVPNGVLRSEDSGRTWNLFPGVATRSFSFHPSVPTTVYAASDLGILKSADEGRSWNSTVSVLGATYAVLADKLNPSVLYSYYGGYSYWNYSYYPYRPVKSTDGGSFWTEAATGLPTGTITALAMDPVQTATLYTAIAVSDPPWIANFEAIYRTTDGAANWSAASGDLGSSTVAALVVDPANSSILYAATDRGVYRSTDAATSWLPLNDGLGNLRVQSLSIDEAGHLLHAGTAGGGLFRLEIASPGFPCETDEDRTCLLGGRFQITASARPRIGNLARTTRPVSIGDRFGGVGLGPADAAPDIFIKMVDGRDLPGHSFWFFHTGLTNDAYALTVTDTVTGRVRVYQNDPATPGCGEADAGAFPENTMPMPSGASALPGSSLAAGEGGTLILAGGRFQVTLSTSDRRTGRTASGLAMPQADLYGYFSLPDFTGDPAFPEVFVRLTQQRDGSFALSHTGLTDLDYTLTVTDTATAAVQTYRNNTTDTRHPCGSSVSAP